MSDDDMSASRKLSSESSTDGAEKLVRKKLWPWSWFIRKKSDSKKPLDHRNYPLW